MLSSLSLSERSAQMTCSFDKFSFDASICRSVVIALSGNGNCLIEKSLLDKYSAYYLFLAAAINDLNAQSFMS